MISAHPKTHSRTVGKSRFERSILSIMKMDEATWLRHANPWSVWSRLTTLPLLALALWSREWIGVGFLFPVAVAIFWIWLNPRLFPQPTSYDHWPAKATFGERVWLNRSNIPIPRHHERAAMMLIFLIMISIMTMVYGLYVLSLWPTLAGLAAVMLSKLWFCDRMVWLYDDMRKKSAVYASWSQRPGNDNDALKVA